MVPKEHILQISGDSGYQTKGWKAEIHFKKDISFEIKIWLYFYISHRLKIKWSIHV